MLTTESAWERTPMLREVRRTKMNARDLPPSQRPTIPLCHASLQTHDELVEWSLRAVHYEQ